MCLLRAFHHAIVLVKLLMSPIICQLRIVLLNQCTISYCTLQQHVSVCYHTIIGFCVPCKVLSLTTVLLFYPRIDSKASARVPRSPALSATSHGKANGQGTSATHFGHVVWQEQVAARVLVQHPKEQVSGVCGQKKSTHSSKQLSLGSTNCSDS